MEGLVIVIAWLAINIWATSFVAKRGFAADQRSLFYLMIWLLPFIGAALAILIPSLQSKFKSTDSTDRIFQTVVEKHKDKRTG